MKVVDPRIHAAFKKAATPNASDWFQYVDGQHDGDDIRLLFQVYLGERGFEGCARSEFLDELAKLLPDGAVEFKKNLNTVHVVDQADSEKLVMKFENGTTATADIVIGCDGIHSRLRQIVLGEDNPASYPHYSHKYAIRGLIPMDKAVAALGQEKPSTRFMYLGPNAHVLTFPVAQGSFLNVVGFVTDPKEWPHANLTAKTTRAEVMMSFVQFGPTVRKIIELLPETLDQWAVFDTVDHPAPSYLRDRLVLLGDAAHAASPHHGAGAGCGIEDAAALCALLEAASQALSGCSRHDKAQVIRAALLSYDAVRRERTSWLVESSRFIGELYEWQTDAGSDPDKCHREAYDRSHRIWDYNLDEMIRTSHEQFSSRIK